MNLPPLKKKIDLVDFTESGFLSTGYLLKSVTQVVNKQKGKLKIKDDANSRGPTYENQASCES
jgi:hypothetical protein